MNLSFLSAGTLTALLLGSLASAVPPSPGPSVSSGYSHLNVISSAGNGVGNRIVVDNGGQPGESLTILSGVRHGYGNVLLIRPAGKLADIPGLYYRGKANGFWTQRAYSRQHQCQVYWDPVSWMWYTYHAQEDCYLPVGMKPEAIPALARRVGRVFPTLPVPPVAGVIPMPPQPTAPVPVAPPATAPEPAPVEQPPVASTPAPTAEPPAQPEVPPATTQAPPPEMLPVP